MEDNGYIKGRGAQINTHNRFESLRFVREHWEAIDEDYSPDEKTQFIEVFPKTILNKVDSPDIGAEYSMNPYQGCEHGCIYCYARNSHEYWGYSAGVDFEKKILVKKNAADLLEKAFRKKGHEVYPIMLSGNTDCYQPVERKLGITRSLLEVCLKYKHPVGIISKNTLMLRDLDILSEMAKKNLIWVTLSITTMDEKIRRVLEPRTASGIKKMQAIRVMTDHGIPVSVNMAPVIPALTSSEIPQIAKLASEHGAVGFHHQIVRLNGWIGEIFEDWVRKNFPDRADKVIHQVMEAHGGKLNDSRFGTRMKGEGNIAIHIYDLVKIARKKYFSNRSGPELNTDLFDPDAGNSQMKLF